MCSSVDYWRCRWIKLGGALEYPQRGPSDPHLEPDLSTVCPQGYPQGWRADPQGWRGGTRRCGGARASSRRRRGHRRAGPTGRSASRSPCGRAGPAPPLRLRLTAALPRHRSPRAVPSARSPWARSPVRHPLAPGRAVRSKPWGSIRGWREPQGRRPRLRPHPGARPDRGARMVDIVGVLLRTRIGSESEGLPAQRGCAGVGAPARPRTARRRPPGSARARAVRWTPLHAGPSPHPSRSPRPSRRGRGRFGGGATRPLKKVAGADLSPPPPRAPPVPKWRNDAILRTRRSRRAPERYAPSTFFRPADAPGRNGGAAGGLHRARTVIDTGPDRDGGGRQPVAPRESPHRPGSGPHQPDPSRPPSSVRPARTSAPTLGRGPARARRRDSGDQVAGLGAPGTRTGTATGNNGAFDDAEKSEDPHGHGDGARP